MLVIQSIRHLLQPLDRYVSDKIARLVGASSMSTAPLQLLVDKFLASEMQGEADAETVIVPKVYAADRPQYQRLINAYGASQLSWGKLMGLSHEDLKILLTDQLIDRIDLSLLKLMIICRFRHQMAIAAESAENALIEREVLELEVAAQKNLIHTIQNRLDAIERSAVSESFGWNQLVLYFTKHEVTLSHLGEFNFQTSLIDPQFMHSPWSEDAFNQQIIYNLINKKLSDSNRLFEEREAAKRLWDAEKLGEQMQHLELRDSSVASSSSDVEVKLDSSDSMQDSAQSEKIAALESAFKEKNQQLLDAMKAARKSITKEELDEAAREILQTMNEFAAQHQEGLNISLDAEEGLLAGVELCFQDAESLLKYVLSKADVKVTPIDRLTISAGPCSGESEEQIASLRFILLQACDFIQGQNRLNMRPGAYQAAVVGQAHPAMILTVQALNYILECADREAESTIPGSQRSWFGAACSAVVHPIAVASRFIGGLFYDPKVAEEKRKAVSQLVSDFNAAMPCESNKNLKEKNWTAALNRLDAANIDLSELSYRTSLTPQQSLLFLRRTHELILESAPQLVREKHQQCCRMH